MLSAPNGGTIVNVSSVLGQLPAAGLADYSASKAGLSALHQTLEAELRVARVHNKVKMLLVETGQLSTPLFDWVKTPNTFFAPILEPVQVAQEIVAAIDDGRGGVIRLPAFAALARWYAVFPAGLQRIARYLSGIDHAVADASSTRDPSDHATSVQNLQSDARWYAVFPAGLQRIARYLSGIDHAVADASSTRDPSDHATSVQNLQSDSESVDTDG